MFILRRKAQEVIVVDGRITITVHRIEGNRVALAFDAPRHGFHLRFRSDSSGRLGRFDASGKTINLNPDNPAIAELKAAKNKSGLLVIASAIIADHNAENDGTQKLMPYGKGDFIGPYTSLVTSLIKPEAKSDV